MRAKRILFLCLVGLLAGCVPLFSLNPLFTKESIVFDEKLLGTWIDDSNDPGESWEFARFEGSSVGSLPKELQSESKQIYRVNYTDREGHKGALVACLVKLGDRRFLDLFPDRFPSGESDPNNMKLPSNAFFFLPCHVFVRVDDIGKQLKIGFPGGGDFRNDFRKLVEAEPKAVAYATTDRAFILTGSTKELQAFVTRYVDDERLFADGMALVRKTK